MTPGLNLEGEYLGAQIEFNQNKNQLFAQREVGRDDF